MKDNWNSKPDNGNSLRVKIHKVIFEADTPMGKLFDELLIVCILLSVLAVMLESVAGIRADYEDELHIVEWFFTIVFTVEYVLRLISVARAYKYMTSFFGVVDLLAIVPTYLSLFMPGSQFLIVVRIIRVLRVFRILKFVKYLNEADMLTRALKASRRKITVFLFTVSALVVILGSLMYLIEGDENGFKSIPDSIYWAVVTLTTVGYGDILPQTVFGRMLASVVMILGYGIIAVPTGIVTAEVANVMRQERVSTQVCFECLAEHHDVDAVYCKKCGAKLD